MNRPQRERTKWDWKPLIVIPMMVYLNAAPQPKGDLPGRVVSESASAGSGLSVAAPVQGVTGRGEAYVLERNPKYPLLRFEMRLLQPNTIVDRRSGI